MDQGWTVPSIKGVEIRRKIKHISISRVMDYLLCGDAWMRGCDDAWMRGSVDA